MSEQTRPASDSISFGPFRLIPAQHLLLEGDKPVRVGSRACEILIALVKQPGRLLSKQELLRHVWPNTFVEESSLRVHMAALRRALRDGKDGSRYITNTPGRGYCFVAPVALSAPVDSIIVPEMVVERQAEMPLPPARLVGRSEIVINLAQQLQIQRFVSIVGPGGIGKTTVAVAIAESLPNYFKDGIRFVDLAPLSDPALVPSALAALVGLGVRSDNLLPALIAFLKNKHILIVLDSCEHVIEAAAVLAEQIYNSTKETYLLTTSREALRVAGERVHRLTPLSIPGETGGLKAAEALEFASVQLFVDCAAASLGTFELKDAEAPLVADICRRLDGIALAIEIVASRVDTFGVAEIRRRLSESFQLVMQGRRTALPRHQTLSAALDWSYSQLPEFERLLLCRLAVFAGFFTMESATAIVSTGDNSGGAIVNGIASLIIKSLLSADLSGPIGFYRLLDTTRAYMLARFEANGERDSLARLHAEHYLSSLRRAEVDWEIKPATEWLSLHRHLLDNVRAALDWSFSPGGDITIGIALTVCAVPLWFELSLTSECAERVDRALAACGEHRNPDREMRLYAARAWSLMQTRGFVVETQAAWSRVLELSREQGNVDYQLRALWGLWASLLNRCELEAALAFGKQFSELAKTQTGTGDRFVGDRMVGYILHLMGDQTQARQYLKRMLEGYEVPVAGAQLIRFVFDQRATAQCFLARILWLQGHADRAIRLIDKIVDDVLTRSDILSSCQVLVQAACPVTLLVGDLAAAERYVTALLEYSARQGLDFWQAYGRCFKGVLIIKRGEFAEGVAALGAALEDLRRIQFGVYYGVFLGEFAGALGQVGRAAGGLAAIDEAIARCERNNERWYMADLLRIRGELSLRQGSPDPKEAERYFRKSLDCAHQQQAPAWELRAANSLTKLLHAGGRDAEARSLLGPLYAKFTEGFDTQDLREAKGMLTALAAN